MEQAVIASLAAMPNKCMACGGPCGDGRDYGAGLVPGCLDVMLVFRMCAECVRAGWKLRAKIADVCVALEKLQC